MAQESCNLDKEEAEILKPPPSPPPPPHQSSATSQPHLFMNSPPQEFTAKKLEKVENQSREQKPAAAAAARLGNRCSSCRKRVGLTGFRCRCGDLFCGVHRYSDTHDCSFDYKALGREQISKDNPVVRAAKIIKI